MLTKRTLMILSRALEFIILKNKNDGLRGVVCGRVFA
jgi:hypothetical protein